MDGIMISNSQVGRKSKGSRGRGKEDETEDKITGQVSISAHS